MLGIFITPSRAWKTGLHNPPSPDSPQVIPPPFSFLPLTTFPVSRLRSFPSLSLPFSHSSLPSFFHCSLQSSIFFPDTSSLFSVFYSLDPFFFFFFSFLALQCRHVRVKEKSFRENSNLQNSPSRRQLCPPTPSREIDESSFFSPSHVMPRPRSSLEGKSLRKNRLRVEGGGGRCLVTERRRQPLLQATCGGD